MDGVKISRNQNLGFFAGSIQTYSAPESFWEEVFLQRKAKVFDFSYRVSGDGRYRIHLVYNVSVKSSQYTYKQSGTEAFSFDFTANPSEIPGVARSSHLVIETDIAYSWTVSELEDVLYGTDSTDARMPSPDEVFSIFESNSILIITDNGDGTWTATGPDSVITMLDSTTFQISWPSAVYLTSDKYKIQSL